MAFQSTLPLRGTTWCGLSRVSHGVISIHAPLAGNDRHRRRRQQSLQISIHAPLAGNDAWSHPHCSRPTYFNPRSPCGERLRSAPSCCRPDYFNPRSPCGERPERPHNLHDNLRFQSTLPLRGTTGYSCAPVQPQRYFNPRSPCGERPQDSSQHPRPMPISIHAPLAGNDADHLVGHCIFSISIHAPLAGNDGISWSNWTRIINFNPRSPCGERLHKWTSKVHRMRQYLIHALESISSSPHIHFKMTCNQVLYF